jgi:hypothetical protein
MQVKSKLLSILRIIEAFRTSDPGFAEYVDIEDFIKEINKLIDDNDRKTIASVLKAMMLLTAANVDIVRDPSKYDASKVDYWDMHLDAYDIEVSTIVNGLQIPIDFDSKPTQQDYVMAKKLLPIIGSHKFTPGNYQGDLDLDKEIYGTVVRDKVKGQKLFRGIRKMSLDAFFTIMDKEPWDMIRGVSTSINVKRSRTFAGITLSRFSTGEGPAMLFSIRNEQGRGFHAGKLSKYRFEEEVILSGKIIIHSWTFKAFGSIRLDGSATKENAKLSLSDDNLTLTIESESFSTSKKMQSVEEFKEFISVAWYASGTTLETDKGTIYIRIPKVNMLLEIESEVVDP